MYELTYKNFHYKPWQDFMEDNIKIFHQVNDDIFIDWSPYRTLKKEDFELWIDLGMPNRDHEALQYEGKWVHCPLTSEDLQKIKKFKGL